MSLERVREEVKDFLISEDVRVLSISGRWGVGKTYVWKEAIKEYRTETKLHNYAYVSVFGLNSIDALRTRIIQETVSLEHENLRPSFETFIKSRSLAEAKALGRRHLGRLAEVAKNAPHVGWIGSAVATVVSAGILPIKDQIICIDDLERAGDGLNIRSIIGLVSILSEQRGCKIALLLNEDELGCEKETYRRYLEKAVDQAITLDPTAQESSAIAIRRDDKLGQRVVENAIKLGITNIRVIRRIRIHLEKLEKLFQGRHDETVRRLIVSLTLLGWCIWEPQLAPKIEDIKKNSSHCYLMDSIAKDFPSEDNKKYCLSVDQNYLFKKLSDIGIQSFSEIDAIIEMGLTSGIFNQAALEKALDNLDDSMRHEEARRAIWRPWELVQDSFEDNGVEVAKAFSRAIEEYGLHMDPYEASSALYFVEELIGEEEGDRLLESYIKWQSDKPREYFEQALSSSINDPSKINSEIIKYFQKRLKDLQPKQDPIEILVKSANHIPLTDDDARVLASFDEDYYYLELNNKKCARDIVTALNNIQNLKDRNSDYRKAAETLFQALKRLFKDSKINELRLGPYLKDG